MKKTIALVLALSMMVAVFTGCGGKSEDSGNSNTSTPSSEGSASASPEASETSEDSEYNFAVGKYDVNEDGYPTAPYDYTMPLSTTGEVLSIWTTVWTPQYIPDDGYGSMEYPKFLSEHTGVNIEYSIVSSDNRQENFAVLLASDDLSDISSGGYAFYTGTIRNAIEDNWFVNLYDYKDYMPNYVYQATSRDSVDVYSKVFYDDDLIPCFYTIYPDPLPANGYMCRKDWCDDLGIDVNTLTTYDDIHNMLVGFKSLGVESPMEIYKTIELSIGVEFAGYNTTAYANPYGLPYARTVDGQVQFTLTTDDDRDAMTMLNQWYSEGLIDKNWSSYNNNTDIQSVFTTNKSGYCNFSPGEIGDLEAQTDDPDATWESLPRAKKTNDQVLKYGQALNQFSYGSWCISAKCANIPLAVTYADWFYSTEGSLYGSYGVEGYSWNYDANGNVRLTDFMTNNPNGLGTAWCLCLYAMNALADAGMEILCRKYAYDGGERLEAMHQKWVIDGYVGEYDFPTSISFSQEQEDELNLYRSEIVTYINENYLAFIDGSKPLSEWDDYVSELNNLGLSKCRDIYQEAYDTFQQRFASKQ